MNILHHYKKTVLLLPLLAFNLSLSSFAETSAPQKAVLAPTAVATVDIFKAADQLWNDKKTDEAIAAYQKIITENPENKLAYQRLAGVYLISNKSEEAISAYQDAIIHDPENPKLFASMSIAYLHQGKYSMAKAMAAEAIRIDPSMESAKKIALYADEKEAVIAQANKSGDAKMPPHGAALNTSGSALSDGTKSPHAMPAHSTPEKSQDAK